MSSLLWFDDKVDERNALVSDVAEKLGLDLIVARSKSDASISSWTEAVLQHSTDDVALILMDHSLADSGNNPFSTGASLCMALRSVLKGVPIVGLSASSREDIRAEECEEYTEFIQLGNIKDCIASLKVIVEGFSMLRSLPKEEVGRQVKAIFNTPNDDDIFQRIVPLEIMSRIPIEVSHALYRWFRDVLFKFQGPLVDGDMIAASIGAKKTFFDKDIAPLIKDETYTGVFAGLNGPRYWRDATFAHLADIVEDDGSIELSHYIDEFDKTHAYRELCFVCKKPHTEVIANEEQSVDCKKKHALHFRCAEPANLPHPNYFDPMYVVLGGVIR